MKVILHIVYKLIKKETKKRLINSKLKNNLNIGFIKIEILQIL